MIEAVSLRLKVPRSTVSALLCQYFGSTSPKVSKHADLSPDVARLQIPNFEP